MAKDLVNNPETKLGGAKKPYMDLGGHLEYIESLLEGGAGGGGNELYFDLSPYMETMQLDTEGLEKFENAIAEAKILGVTLIGTGLFFNYKGIYQSGSDNYYYFSSSNQAVLISFEGAISESNSIDIPFLPSDASTKNYALNSVNGALTWNTIGDGLEIKDGALQATGSGGKSVPPTLNLFDFGTGAVRTTITEEEKTNLENELYNQVIYNDGDAFSMYSPSKLFSIEGGHYFTQFKIFTNVDETFSYSSMILNAITIGEKNTSNEYPITVTDVFTINPPSASGGSNIDKLDIEFTFNGTTTLTSEQVSLVNSYNNKYVYVKFNEGIVRDNAYIGYVFNLQNIGTYISIVSQPNISGNIIIQSSIAIQGTTAVHQERTMEFSTINSGKFLKTNAEGNPEWASISTPTITFED